MCKSVGFVRHFAFVLVIAGESGVGFAKNGRTFRFSGCKLALEAEAEGQFTKNFGSFCSFGHEFCTGGRLCWFPNWFVAVGVADAVAI